MSSRILAIDASTCSLRNVEFTIAVFLLWNEKRPFAQHYDASLGTTTLRSALKISRNQFSKKFVFSPSLMNLYKIGPKVRPENSVGRNSYESFSTGIFKKQITRLIIATPRKKKDSFTIVKICSCIFSIFNKLTHLTFSESSYENFVSLLFDVPSRSFSSSSLLVLNIKVQHFSQLLYVLDGRFSQLHTLIVDLINNVLSTDLIENKCFVLSCAWEISRYEECLLPLIYRMSNIEKLDLC
ncbi:unnamed protein product [Rotaria magnacalcarata]